jgi:hypothetical protein
VLGRTVSDMGFTKGSRRRCLLSQRRHKLPAQTCMNQNEDGDIKLSGAFAGGAEAKRHGALLSDVCL